MELIIFIVVFIAWFFYYKNVFKYIYDIKHKIFEKKFNYNNYETKDYFFSKQELFFYRQLRFYLKDKEALIFSKVRISDLVKVNSNKSEYYKYLYKINQKHIDYVITNYSGQILCLIELDWKSHNNIRVKENDKFKSELFNNLGLPFFRYENYQYHNFKLLDKVF